MFEQVKKFYDLGIYSKAMVRLFVEKGKLTEEEYNSIVGEVEDDGAEA